MNDDLLYSVTQANNLHPPAASMLRPSDCLSVRRRSDIICPWPKCTLTSSSSVLNFNVHSKRVNSPERTIWVSDYTVRCVLGDRIQTTVTDMFRRPVNASSLNFNHQRIDKSLITNTARKLVKTTSSFSSLSYKIVVSISIHWHGDNHRAWVVYMIW